MYNRDEFVEILWEEAKGLSSKFTIDEATEIVNEYCQYLEDYKRGYGLVTRERINNLKFIPDALLQLYLSYARFVMRFWSKVSEITKHISLKCKTRFFCRMYLDYIEHGCKWFGVIDGVKTCLNERRV